ncbi:hypothetical protein OZX72_05520 [Bifidobacterium sp. ESL0769]|uniref:hypothetical protein n=1 Tax=Bifidobacterium sp. ESL0769 TaxID=2983229 RepID=UPI0023F8488B|nr:hypothetical protein [Bifidobacterium sp. ESL0769]WEV66731.1 hypothetical protein OZX72_05520 [Bifidobacterium sp. ESL0769]
MAEESQLVVNLDPAWPQIGADTFCQTAESPEDLLIQFDENGMFFEVFKRFIEYLSPGYGGQSSLLGALLDKHPPIDDWVRKYFNFYQRAISWLQTEEKPLMKIIPEVQTLARYLLDYLQDSENPDEYMGDGNYAVLLSAYLAVGFGADDTDALTSISCWANVGPRQQFGTVARQLSLIPLWLTDFGGYKSLWREQYPESRMRVLQKLEDRRESWKSAGLCAYCGGSFTGMFKKHCTKCGRDKDY